MSVRLPSRRVNNEWEGVAAERRERHFPVLGTATYPAFVIEAGKRKRNQPAPIQAVYDALLAPDRARQWLKLTPEEQPPQLLEAVEPHLVVWSSLWPQRPDAVIRFDLPADASGQGTDLTWTLVLDEPEPHPSLLGHLRKRINELVNAELRYSFGQ